MIEKSQKQRVLAAFTGATLFSLTESREAPPLALLEKELVEELAKATDRAVIVPCLNRAALLLCKLGLMPQAHSLCDRHITWCTDRFSQYEDIGWLADAFQPIINKARLFSMQGRSEECLRILRDLRDHAVAGVEFRINDVRIGSEHADMLRRGAAHILKINLHAYLQDSLRSYIVAHRFTDMLIAVRIFSKEPFLGPQHARLLQEAECIALLNLGEISEATETAKRLWSTCVQQDYRQPAILLRLVDCLIAGNEITYAASSLALIKQYTEKLRTSLPPVVTARIYFQVALRYFILDDKQGLNELLNAAQRYVILTCEQPLLLRIATLRLLSMRNSGVSQKDLRTANVDAVSLARSCDYRVELDLLATYTFGYVSPNVRVPTSEFFNILEKHLVA